MEKSTGYVVISTKAKLSNNISSIDSETWSEIGEMMKELMVKIEVNTNCHDFGVEIKTGEEAVKMWKEEAELPANENYPESEFLVCLYPMYKTYRWWKNERPVKRNSFVGSMENERIASEINDPDSYAKIWDKKVNQKRENIWKQPYLYLAFASGMGIVLLVWIILFRNKKRK